MPLYNPASGGTDATLTFTDVTTNNSSTSKHGFLKKLDNTATNFMNGQGNWSAPASSPTTASDTAAVATDETLTGNNSFTDLATSGPAVTVTVNTKALVIVSTEAYFSANTGAYAAMDFALSSGNTRAATRVTSFIASTGDDTTTNTIIAGSRATLLTGLTPGSTVFTAKYSQLGGAGTSHWQNRNISVILLD